ncbi:sulfite exporter TauE/SafE family protein [Yoonia sp.]|uniref:sulfite exporter TauE/SafE family protein n=1 Tax=Yoonia sp. TaxID=2212373 RepID=UPI00391ACFA9
MNLLEFLMPDGMTGLTFGILVMASFLSSLITFVFGIGGGGLLLAIMAALVPPAALIPTHGVIQLSSNLGRVVIVFRHVFWPALPAFVVGSVFGAVLGGMVVVSLPPAWVQISIGAFVAWSVLGKTPTGLRRWPLAVGAVSSFLTMFFGATGLFVAAFTKAQELGRHAHVSTHAALMTVQHGLKTFVFGLLGFAFAPWLPFIVVMSVAGLLGSLIGSRFLNRIDDRRFRFCLDAVLLLLSIHLIYAGLTGL